MINMKIKKENMLQYFLRKIEEFRIRTSNFIFKFKKMKIKKLTKLSIQKIKSYSELSNFDECILELLYNSIDANPSYVCIKLDFEKFFIEITDDGDGFEKESLNLIGDDNVTSKFPADGSLQRIDTYGFHGQTLSNIIYLSDRIELITREKGRDENYFKKEFSFPTNVNGRSTERIESVDINDDKIKFENGFEFSTKIQVYNLFGKHPLRQKQIKENSHNIQYLIKKLQIISLVNYEIQFLLKDLRNNFVIFESKRADSIKAQFCNHFGLNLKQNLINHSFKSPINSNYQINGFIYAYSKSSINSNFQFNIANILQSKLQFLFLNKFFIQNIELYDLIVTKLLACKEFNLLSYSKKQISFCLVISCPFTDYELNKRYVNNSDSKRKTIAEFNSLKIELFYIDLINSFIEDFLKLYGYKNLNELIIQYNKSYKKNEINKFDEYGKQIFVEDLKNAKISKTVNKQKKILPETLKSNQNTIAPIKQCWQNKKKQAIQLHLPAALNKHKFLLNEYKTAKDTDLKSRLTYEHLNTRLNPRKFVVSIDLNKNQKRKSFENKSVQTDEILSIPNLKENWVCEMNSDGIEFYLNKNDGTTTFDLDLVLKSPDQEYVLGPYLNGSENSNPDFLNAFKPRPKEERETLCNNIDQIKNNFKQILQKQAMVKWRNTDEYQKNLSFKSTIPMHDDFFSTECNLDSTSSIKFDKNILRKLNIIGQLDSKFIVTFTKLNQNGFALFLFDQHAVHERIRLENLLKDNLDDHFNISSENLEEPLIIELQKLNETFIQNFKLKMKKLGFTVELNQSCVKIESLNILKLIKIPTILLKNLRKDKYETLNLINRLIESQIKSCFNNYNRTENSNNAEFHLSQLPIELIEIFNMNACRGAIKFGDKLTRQNCCSLIQDLTKCSLPFQCAHGRPTFLPITNIFTKNEARGKLKFKNLNF